MHTVLSAHCGGIRSGRIFFILVTLSTRRTLLLMATGQRSGGEPVAIFELGTATNNGGQGCLQLMHFTIYGSGNTTTVLNYGTVLVSS